jgi:hypothetical protein
VTSVANMVNSEQNSGKCRFDCTLASEHFVDISVCHSLRDTVMFSVTPCKASNDMGSHARNHICNILPDPNLI